MAVTATTVQTYLGLPDIDTARADLLIEQATNLVKSIVGETVPDEADAVILSSVGRAYVNPLSANNQTAGPYNISLPSGGVYLTRAERATLGRLTDRGTHFVIDGLPADYEEPVE